MNTQADKLTFDRGRSNRGSTEGFHMIPFWLQYGSLKTIDCSNQNSKICKILCKIFTPQIKGNSSATMASVTSECCIAE